MSKCIFGQVAENLVKYTCPMVKHGGGSSCFGVVLQLKDNFMVGSENGLNYTPTNSGCKIYYYLWKKFKWLLRTDKSTMD